ncbi:NADPH-dependent FMN reductase [Tenggerimyces flavus]|uniref:NADPH-dependent FMN reductase n=1 Tax=Tenggerimyces flavus TaxID=1708749 RepID=A0ABV7YD84_9ACTN|nr:FMN reductase [Tenggerimyces flavus]
MSTPTPHVHDENGHRVVVLVGNPRPASRTRAAAEALAAGLGATPFVIDLAEFGGAVLDGSPEVDAALETVRTASVLIVATPVYKASYTGLLKAFLDRYDNRALEGVVAIPFTVAAAPIHRLTADVHLRPLLVELGASTPTRAFAIEESALPNLDAVVTTWVSTELSLLPLAGLTRV